jgi:SAM-dependent methyltransferase
MCRQQMSSAMSGLVQENVERSVHERRAYDEHYGFQERNDRLHGFLSHARVTPAANRVHALQRRLVLERARTGTALEIGCGSGGGCVYLMKAGAHSVHGCDLSERMLSAASGADDYQGRLRFFQHDVHIPFEGTYDVIFGRAVLHHIAYRDVLPRLLDQNLRSGGLMAFLEPLGDNPLLRLYWLSGGLFHTADERPFRRADIVWMQHRFPGFRMIPCDCLGLPGAVLSSLLFTSPDNRLLRACDRADQWLAERWPTLGTHFRSALFLFPKAD